MPGQSSIGPTDELCDDSSQPDSTDQYGFEQCLRASANRNTESFYVRIFQDDPKANYERPQHMAGDQHAIDIMPGRLRPTHRPVEQPSPDDH